RRGEALQADPAAARRRHAQREDLLRAGCDVDRADGPAARRELDLETRSGRPVHERDLELGPVPGEHRQRADQPNLEAEEVVVGVVHRDEPEPGEQEREHEAQARAVVQRAEQHREHAQREDHAEPGRQDVDPAPLEHDAGAVPSLAAPGPPGGPALEAAEPPSAPAVYRGERLRRAAARVPPATGTAGSTAAPAWRRSSVAPAAGSSRCATTPPNTAWTSSGCTPPCPSSRLHA